MDDGFVADGEFVEPGGDGSVAFEPVDVAFHRVALLVDVGIEGWWTAALRPLLAAVGILVGLAGNSGFNPALAQVAAVDFGGVGLVDRDELRAVAACPPVNTSDSGFWPCSQARCSFVDNPPRERPNA